MSLPNRPIKLRQELIDGAEAFNILSAVSIEFGCEYFKLICGHINSDHIVDMLV